MLTASHCLVGAVEVKVFYEDFETKEISFYEVDSFYLHPKYDLKTSNYVNDIGKIKLKQNLPSIHKIQKVVDLNNYKKDLYRVGFGLRNGENNLTVIGPIKNFTTYFDFFETYDEFSYSGDSGGPIFQKSGKGFNLVGIHSTRENSKCYNLKIFQYLDWILE